jgi:putative tryptophan/tyrosine transport system substrate-binding protein
MKRRDFIGALGGAAAWPLVARAQQAAIPVVGLIGMRSTDVYEPFGRGLSEVGFVDRRNVLIDYRAAFEVAQLPAFAIELVRNKVAVISAPTPAIIAAQAVTGTIPMVFIGAPDPVAVGLVASFNRPGGNVTGVRLVAGDLPSKQIELIHELLPQATKVGLFMSPNFPNSEPEAAAASDAARLFELTPVVEQVMIESEFEPAFARFEQKGVNAILIIANVFFASYRDRLIDLGFRHGILMFGQSRNETVAGALASYGTNYSEVIRQAGIYTGRILKGEKPADLPVLQPTKFELVINLKTAKALGLTIPPSLLARADEVIE